MSASARLLHEVISGVTEARCVVDRRVVSGLHGTHDEIVVELAVRLGYDRKTVADALKLLEKRGLLRYRKRHLRAAARGKPWSRSRKLPANVSTRPLGREGDTIEDYLDWVIGTLPPQSATTARSIHPAGGWDELEVSV